MGMAAFNAMRRRRKAEEEAKAKQQAQAKQQAKAQLGKMTVAELEAKAAELGLVFPEDATNKAQKAAFLVAHLENKG